MPAGDERQYTKFAIPTNTPKRHSMIRPLIMLTIVFASTIVFAEDQKAPAPPVYGWHHGLLSQLTLTQAGYTDWVGGGDNALSYALSVDGK